MIMLLRLVQFELTLIHSNMSDINWFIVWYVWYVWKYALLTCKQ